MTRGTGRGWTVGLLVLACLLAPQFCSAVLRREQYYESKIEAWGRDVRQTPDGGYIVAGRWDGAAVLIRTDSLGTRLWQRDYPPCSSYQIFLDAVLSIPRAGPVTMRLYSTTGRTAEIVRMTAQRAGWQEFTLSKGLAPGIYFIRGLETEDGRPGPGSQKVVIAE